MEEESHGDRHLEHPIGLFDSLSNEMKKAIEVLIIEWVVESCEQIFKSCNTKVALVAEDEVVSNV